MALVFKLGLALVRALKLTLGLLLLLARAWLDSIAVDCEATVASLVRPILLLLIWACIGAECSNAKEFITFLASVCCLATIVAVELIFGAVRAGAFSRELTLLLGAVAVAETTLSDCFAAGTTVAVAAGAAVAVAEASAGVAAAAETGTAALATEAVLASDWPWALLLALALVLATVVALVLGAGALF